MSAFTNVFNGGGENILAIGLGVAFGVALCCGCIIYAYFCRPNPPCQRRERMVDMISTQPATTRVNTDSVVTNQTRTINRRGEYGHSELRGNQHMTRTHVGSISQTTDSSDGTSYRPFDDSGRRFFQGRTADGEKQEQPYPYYGEVLGAAEAKTLLTRGSVPVDTDEMKASPYNIKGVHQLDQTELQLVREIGRGKYGKVYLAHWIDEYVAVKWFKRTEDFGTEEERMRELKLAVQAARDGKTSDGEEKQHDNILQVLGYMIDPFAIVTKYMNRGSVEGFVALGSESRANMTLYDAITMFLHTARGIAHLHSRGIVHRDIAARNLLLETNEENRIERVVISDFGLARINKNNAQNHTYSDVGPLKWMSPEAIVEHTYSPKSDAYSFGITMWEILAGEPPYPETTPVNVAVEVLSNGMRPRIPEWLPQKLSDLIQKCWCTRVEERPSFEEIIKELEMAMQDPSANKPLPMEEIRPTMEKEILPPNLQNMSDTSTKSHNSAVSQTDQGEMDSENEGQTVIQMEPNKSTSYHHPTQSIPIAAVAEEQFDASLGLSDLDNEADEDEMSGESASEMPPSTHPSRAKLQSDSLVHPSHHTNPSASVTVGSMHRGISITVHSNRESGVLATNIPRGVSRSVLVSTTRRDTINEFEEWNGDETYNPDDMQQLPLNQSTRLIFGRMPTAESASSLAIPHAPSLPKLTLNRSQPASERSVPKHSPDPSLSELSTGLPHMKMEYSQPLLLDAQSSTKSRLSQGSQTYAVGELLTGVSFPALPQAEDSNQMPNPRKKKIRTAQGSYVMNSSVVLDAAPLSLSPHGSGNESLSRDSAVGSPRSVSAKNVDFTSKETVYVDQQDEAP